MPEATINGQRYFVRASDEPGATTVLLHGFTGSTATWDTVWALLPGHKLAVDLLGHGRTASPAHPARYTMPAAAADLAQLIERMARPPVHLLGYSMGGRLALYVALHYPDLVARLTLESASPGLADLQARAERTARDNALADAIERDGVAAFVAHWEQLPLWRSQAALPAALLAAQRQQRLGSSARGLANSLRGMGSGVQPSLWESLATLSLPVTVIAGELDDKFVAIGQAMAARLPAARLHIIPSAGHNVHLEQPQAFVTALGAG